MPTWRCKRGIGHVTVMCCYCSTPFIAGKACMYVHSKQCRHRAEEAFRIPLIRVCIAFNTSVYKQNIPFIDNEQVHFKNKALQAMEGSNTRVLSFYYI